MGSHIGGWQSKVSAFPPLWGTGGAWHCSLVLFCFFFLPYQRILLPSCSASNKPRLLVLICKTLALQISRGFSAKAAAALGGGVRTPEACGHGQEEEGPSLGGEGEDFGLILAMHPLSACGAEAKPQKTRLGWGHGAAESRGKGGST